jgi:hypothetical protein
VAGLADFTPATFEPLVGQAFQIVVDDSTTIDAVLVEAAQPDFAGGPGDEPPATRMPFSIVFRGPPHPVLPQRVYRFSHEALGSFELFIVPIAQDEEGTRYEAVFA